MADLDHWETEPVQAFNPELRILSFDIENSLKDISGRNVVGEMDEEEEADAGSEDFYNKRILTICCVLQKDGKIVEGQQFRGGERKILEDFTAYIRQCDPDVISGYNIEGYDLRVIEKRATELEGASDLGQGRQLPLR